MMQLNFKLLLVMIGLCLANVSHADLVRLTHYPAALKKTSGITDESNRFPMVKYTQWMITDAVQNQSPYASGIVIAVKDGIKPQIRGEDGYYSYLSWLYAPGTSFKAVYILTNHHVWTNDRSELQSMSEQLNPNPQRYTMMVATPLFIYDKNGSEVFQNTYFPEKAPINKWNGTSYGFSLEEMGVKELVNCYAPKHNVAEVGQLNFWWGCDFTLIRIIVPSYVKVQPEVLSENRLSNGTELDVWYSANSHGNYRVEKLYGSNREAVVADISGRSAVAVPGWSGSPVLNKADGKLVGLLSSAWPGASTKAGFYNIQYVMKNLDVNNRIEEDFKQIDSARPFKGNFYELFMPNFP